MSFPNDSILRRVVVQVWHEETCIGSGCVVPSSRNNGVFYCFTALHCIKDANTKLFLFSDEGKSEPLEYESMILDEQHDAAILKVNYSAEWYPKEVFVGHINSTYDCAVLVGYPSLRKGDIACYNVKLGHSDVIGRGSFYVCLEDTYTFSDELHEQVVGISGGGCFSIEDNSDYKLIGIETGFVDKQQSFGEIACLDLSIFKELLQKEGWQELERPKYHYSSIPWSNGCNVLDKQKEYDNYDTWIDTVTSVNLIPEIQGHLLSGEVVEPLLLCGFSGIGKTRTVLQACAQDGELSNALIFDSFNDFSEVFQQYLRNYLRSSAEEPVYLIVDNIKIDDWYDLKASIKPYKNAHAVAIAEMGVEDQRTDFPMLRMEPCKEDDVVRIIKNAHPSLDEEDLHAIFRLSDNDLRFALLIAYAYERAPDRCGWNIREMKSDTTSASRIVNRIMHQVEGLSDNEAVKVFSMFVDFGYQNNGRSELEFLSRYFHMSEAFLKQRIDICIGHRLGIQKGNYFELSPRALARFLFSENFSKLIMDFPSFMEQIPTQEMRIRFFERARECGSVTWEEVKGALAPWFQNKYGKTRWDIFPGLDGKNIARLSIGDDVLFSAREAMTYVEFVPEVGLPWLLSLITAGKENLDSFSGYNSGRREIVWTCEHLACFHDFFGKCEQILFYLGLHETEQGISNNSRGVWSDLFGLLQSNTEVSFEDRFLLLLSRMQNYHDEWDTSMIDKALGVALSWGGTRLLPPKMIGGRLTPENWAESHIKNLSDLISIHERALSYLHESYNSLSRTMRQVVFYRLKAEMRNYTAPMIGAYAPFLREEYRRTLEQFAETQDDRLQIIIEIENQTTFLKMLKEKDKEESGGITNQNLFLQQWKDSLSETDFVSRLKVLLSKNIYFSKEDILPEITESAIEFLKLDDMSLTLTSILSSHTWNEYTLGRFAERVGEVDDEFKLRVIAEKMFADGQSTFSEDYFRGICNRESSIPSFLQKILDACVDSNPRGVLHMSVSYDVSDSGLNRILDLLERGEIDNSVLMLTDGRWNEFISQERAESILSLLAKNEARDSCYHFLRIGREWTKVFQQPAFSDFLLSQTKQLSYATLRHFSFEFIPLLEQIPGNRLLDCLILAIQSVDYGNVNGIPIEHYNYIKSHSKGVYSREIANEICNRIEACSLNFMYGVSCSPMVQLLAASPVLEWVGLDEKARAKLIAYHLPMPSLKEISVPSVTLAVLEKYGADKSVFQRFLSGIHAYEVYSYDEVAKGREATSTVLKQYAAHPSKAIRQWAEYETSRIEEILAHKRELEAEYSRFQE